MNMLIVKKVEFYKHFFCKETFYFFITTFLLIKNIKYLKKIININEIMLYINYQS